MPNQWNDFGSGILQGATNFLSGLFEGQAKKHARETHDLAMTNMKNLLASTTPDTSTSLSTNQDNPQSGLINAAPSDTGNQDPLTALFSGYNPENDFSTNVQNMQPGTIQDNNVGINPRTSPPTPLLKTGEGRNNAPTNMLDALYQGIRDLTDQGEYGKPYIPILQSYYEANQPKTPEIKTQIVDGKLIRYDDQGNILTNKQISNEKPQKYSIGNDWQIQDNGDGTYNYYQPTENGWQKTNNTASERDYQRQEGTGEFAPKSPHIGGMGHIKVPKLDVQDASTKESAATLFNTKRQIEGMGGWQNIQNQIQQLSQVGGNLTDLEKKKDPAYETAQDKIKNLQGVLDSYTSTSQQLKGLGVPDPDTFAESIGQGTDLKTAKEEQKQTEQDMNTVIYSKNGIYDNLTKAWNLDSSDPNQAAQIQSILTNLYDWMGKNVYGTSLAPLIYKYVNDEVSKMAASKGLK